MNDEHFKDDIRFQELMDAWRDSELSGEQAAELSEVLRESAVARSAFNTESYLHGLLHCAVDADMVQHAGDLSANRADFTMRKLRGTSGAMRTMLAVAAGLLLVIGATWWFVATPSRFIATLASSENAAWESELPTTPGSKLVPGTLHLKTGVASIQFHSGAMVLIEAPAMLELMTSMRGKLFSGAAVIDVPDSALGFVMESPSGYAIDYGTRFAVRVDPLQQQTDFEIIEGEIAVHHPSSGEEVRLIGEGKSATVSAESMVITDAELDEAKDVPATQFMRVETNGRCGTALRNDKRDRYIMPEVLAVKRTRSGKWDHRSFFEFELPGLNYETIATAKLRLNLIPSTRGLASRLPEVNRFGIYGLTNPAKQNWKVESRWDESPGPDDGVLLGTFNIPRSLQRGRYGIEGDQLLAFLREHRDGPVTFILVRETMQIDGVGKGLTHLFASDQHPEAVGPLLEFTLK